MHFVAGHDAPSTSVYHEVSTVYEVTQPQTYLTMTHHFSITQRLRDLGNEELMALGGALGLYFPHMKRMPLSSFMSDMVAAWLNKEDNVSIASGAPSWNSLVKALKSVEQHGIAHDISQSM